MYQFGGDGWNSWNAAIRELLISEQRTDGDYAGSWDPSALGPIRRTDLFDRVEHALPGSVLSLPSAVSDRKRADGMRARMTKHE